MAAFNEDAFVEELEIEMVVGIGNSLVETLKSGNPISDDDATKFCIPSVYNFAVIKLLVGESTPWESIYLSLEEYMYRKIVDKTLHVIKESKAPIATLYGLSIWANAKSEQEHLAAKYIFAMVSQKDPLANRFFEEITSSNSFQNARHKFALEVVNLKLNDV